MSDKPTVSIIIPVFNAELFIRRAIDSCLCQSFTDYEMILVNDGSKDSSLSILKEYACIDSRIRVIDIPNSGVVKARECGVKAAKAEYLLFLDADDELVDGALKKMADALAPEVDIVIGDINQVEIDGSSSIKKYGNSGYVSGKEHFDWIVREHIGFLWGKFIRKSLVTDIKVMPYGVKFCEDYIQMIQISYNARKVVHIGEVTYNYIQQDESACNKALPIKEYAQRFADLCKNIVSIIDQCHLDQESIVKLKVLFLYYCRLYLCAAGDWGSYKDLKSIFLEYLSDREVASFFKSCDRKHYKMTLIARWLYVIIATIYRRELRQCGRIK